MPQKKFNDIPRGDVKVNGSCLNDDLSDEKPINLHPPGRK